MPFSCQYAPCPECGRRLLEGHRCKRRTCPSYAPVYLRRQAELLRANLEVWDGEVCLMTLTGPGRAELPWDRRQCSHAPGVRCSGRLGCKVDWMEAAHWNSSVLSRWQLLLEAAQAQVRREHGRVARVVVLARVLEAHRRGVFHLHVVLGYRTAADRAALETFRRYMGKAKHRRRYEFGTGRRSFDAGKPGWFRPADAARYVAKYLRPDGAKESFIPLLAGVEGVAAVSLRTRRSTCNLRPVFVNPMLTKRSGVTVGWLRHLGKFWGRHRREPSAGELRRLRFESDFECERRRKGAGPPDPRLTDEVRVMLNRWHPPKRLVKPPQPESWVQLRWSF
jgi:hypothetical protein